MDIIETTSEGLKRGFKVVVSAANVTKQTDQRITKLAASAELPGFRKGKVPASLIKSRYGESLRTEAVEELLETAMQQVVEKCGRPPALEPKVEFTNMKPDQDLEFSIELELMPDITMPEFGSLSLNKPSFTPSADEIEKMLQDVAASDPALQDVAAGKGAANGDTLRVDFRGTIDGHAFEGGSGEDMRVVVGGSGFIPGFTEQMEGITLGEERDITVTFPADYPEAKLAGKDAVFHITAKKVQTPQEATVDDALAERQGFENLTQLRESCERRLKQRGERLTRLRMRRAVLDALADKMTFEAPQGLIDQEFGAIWSQLEHDRKQGVEDEEDKGKTDAQLQDEYRNIAARRVRLGLLLRQVATTNEIEVTEEQLRSAALEEAFRVPSQAMQIMEMFRKNPRMLERLRGPLLEEKVIDFIVERAKVSEQPVTLAELEAEPETEAA